MTDPVRSKEIDKAIGARVRSLRESAAMSEETLASLVSIASDHITQIEAGTLRASAEVLRDLSRIFEVSIGYFFSNLDVEDR